MADLLKGSIRPTRPSETSNDETHDQLQCEGPISELSGPRGALGNRLGGFSVMFARATVLKKSTDETNDELSREPLSGLSGALGGSREPFRKALKG